MDTQVQELRDQLKMFMTNQIKDNQALYLQQNQILEYIVNMEKSYAVQISESRNISSNESKNQFSPRQPDFGGNLADAKLLEHHYRDQNYSAETQQKIINLEDQFSKQSRQVQKIQDYLIANQQQNDSLLISQQQHRKQVNDLKQEIGAIVDQKFNMLQDQNNLLEQQLLNCQNNIKSVQSEQTMLANDYKQQSTQFETVQLSNNKIYYELENKLNEQQQQLTTIKQLESDLQLLSSLLDVNKNEIMLNIGEITRKLPEISGSLSGIQSQQTKVSQNYKEYQQFNQQLKEQLLDFQQDNINHHDIFKSQLQNLFDSLKAIDLHENQDYFENSKQTLEKLGTSINSLVEKLLAQNNSNQQQMEIDHEVTERKLTQIAVNQKQFDNFLDVLQKMRFDLRRLLFFDDPKNGEANLFVRQNRTFDAEVYAQHLASLKQRFGELNAYIKKDQDFSLAHWQILDMKVGDLFSNCDQLIILCCFTVGENIISKKLQDQLLQLQAISPEFCLQIIRNYFFNNHALLQNVMRNLPNYIDVGSESSLLYAAAEIIFEARLYGYQTCEFQEEVKISQLNGGSRQLVLNLNAETVQLKMTPYVLQDEHGTTVDYLAVSGTNVK